MTLPDQLAHPLPVTIRQSRRAACNTALVFGVFGAAAIWLAEPTSGFAYRLLRSLGVYDAFRWFCIGFCVLGLSTSVFVVLRPGSLTIGNEGIRQRLLLRTRVLRWDDVANFRIWTVRRTQFVAFDDLRASTVQPGIRAVSRAVGAEGCLASGWTLSARELSDVLNAARQDWANKNAPLS